MPTPGTTTKRAKDGRKRMKRGVHIDRNKKGDFYAVVVAKNGNVLVKTSECYKSKANTLKALSAAYDRLHQAIILKNEAEFHDHTVAPKKVAGK